MRIEERNNPFGSGYVLCDENREIGLSILHHYDNKLCIINNIYKDLIGKELGSYEDIIGKTFDIAGGAAFIHESFYKFIQETKKREEDIIKAEEFVQQWINDYIF